MAEPENKPEPPKVSHPSGLATLKAYFRGGLKDLQDRIADPWHGAATQQAETGMAGSPTQQEVYDERHGKGSRMEAPEAPSDPLDRARQKAADRPKEASKEIQPEM